MAVSVSRSLADLPELVIEKILRLIPTKAAAQVSFVSKQWQSVLSSVLVRVLDLDEDDDFNRHHNLELYIDFENQHTKFINFLDGYLKYREKHYYQKEKETLDEVRIHMRMFRGRDDYSIITKWLEYAFERGVKRLDISPKMSRRSIKDKDDEKPNLYLGLDSYCLPWVTFANANAKFLTSLNLEHMFIRERTLNFQTSRRHERLLPSLKTMSLSMIYFENKALSILLGECPCIKYLSLCACYFSDWECHISSSSLMSLMIDFCGNLTVVQVDDEAKSLESFTYVGLSSKCEKIILNNSFNLKHVYIIVDHLWEFSLLGCHRELQLTMITKHIEYFDFFDGYFNAKVYMNSVIENARISVGELFDEQEWSWTYFQSLVSFLVRFKFCKKIHLYSRDILALIVPENYRKMVSFSLLPKCSILKVRTLKQFVRRKDMRDMMRSLRWIAPSALILIKGVKNVEQERKQVHHRASPVGYRDELLQVSS